MSESAPLVVFAALAVEAIALRCGARELQIERVGMGPHRARAAAERHDPTCARALAVAGVCGALDPALVPGDVFVPDELRTDDGRAFTADAAGLSEALRARGIASHSGVLVGADHILRPGEHSGLFASGARCVDMESPWLAAAAAGRPFAVMRVVSDGPGASVFRPSILRDGWIALAALRRAAPALPDWARARTLN
ncbi:MAG: 1-hydroxy-2-methyl-2-butenyl 4-diphosphate reductase [Deltaproteobacteria bacterium]|nr:MAG: 1-hydroxy-2-methyl-2-butenyl 4-diphosphate reductase [Deltaproteobacteria bacterium]